MWWSALRGKTSTNRRRSRTRSRHAISWRVSSCRRTPGPTHRTTTTSRPPRCTIPPLPWRSCSAHPRRASPVRDPRSRATLPLNLRGECNPVLLRDTPQDLLRDVPRSLLGRNRPDLLRCNRPDLLRECNPDHPRDCHPDLPRDCLPDLPRDCLPNLIRDTPPDLPENNPQDLPGNNPPDHLRVRGAPAHRCAPTNCSRSRPSLPPSWYRTRPSSSRRRRSAA